MPVITEGPTSARADGMIVGLVNNMPDAALQATERQFATLLDAAAGDRPVRLRFYAMPAIERGTEATAHVAAHYASTDTLGRAPLDALIVTGCEPRAPRLADEPYWPSLTRIVDWAAENTVSTLWSCLAAHAAVLHLDGIERQRLPAKRSGLFDCHVAAADPLLAGSASSMLVPHSRWNDLRERDLVHQGYTVLTRSEAAGVDLFTKRYDSLFVFFQGHPEYDVDSIAREYRRDVVRFLRGERPDYPVMPRDYFAPETAAAFAAVQDRALADRAKVTVRDLPRVVSFSPGLLDNWQASVRPVFRNWLALIAEAAGARSIAA